MATVAELVENAMAFLERRDLEDTLLKKFPQILRTVHSYEKYTHDLTVVQFPDPVLQDNRFYILPTQIPLLRDILDVKIYSGYHDSIIGTTPVKVGDNRIQQTFRDLSQGNSQADYFSYAYPQGWNKLGNQITLVGVSSDVKLIDVLCSVWPTWEYSAVKDSYTTNSWIMEKYPQLIEQHLLIYGAKNAQQTDVHNTAVNDLGDIYNQFLNEFAGDIYGRKST